ncbi:MAG: hypothetical protein ACLFV2_03155 [Desulfurivibrionaceae bacterium]
MQEIHSLKAEEGMVLARDVLTSDSRILCGKGTTLTQAIIDRIRKMDIQHITVEGQPFEEEGQKTLEEELQDIERRFSKVEKIPPLMYLKKRLRQRLINSRK